MATVVFVLWIVFFSGVAGATLWLFGRAFYVLGTAVAEAEECDE